MRLWMRVRMLWCLPWLACGWGAQAGQAAPVLPNAQEVLQKMVERADEVQARLKAQQLSYSKRSITERLSQHGAVKEREDKLYDVLFRKGRVRMTVLKINGQDTKDARRGDDYGEANDGQHEEMQPPRGEERPLVITDEMLARYQFDVVDLASKNERTCFALQFHPKPGLKEDGLAGRFLNRLEGKLWIDHLSYELVRAEIALQSPVQVFGGLIGALSQFHYTLQRSPVADGFWFNHASQCDFELRKLLVSHRYRMKSEWQDINLEHIQD